MGVLVAGVRRAQELFATAPLAGLVSGPLQPRRVLDDDQQIEADVRSTAASTTTIRRSVFIGCLPHRRSGSVVGDRAAAAWA